ncbi:MAG: hypothetical protein E7170_01700 [Firmicutes bacterium]|nr:hypothetical protein [Bacillota bacterium]
MIKYIGKKHLNSNLYKKIILKENDDYIEIKSLVDERFKNVPTLKLSNLNILEQIEGMNETQIIEEIVMYFLRNNDIYEVIQTKGKIIVVSASSRILELQISNKFNSLVNDIINKYNVDRIKFINDNTFEKIVINLNPYSTQYKNVDSISSYFVYNNNLFLTLLNKNYNLVKFEEEFIYNYIDCLINKSTDVLRYEYDGLRYDIYLDDLIIEIPKILNKERKITNFVQNKRVNKLDTDYKQLKLEVRTWKK